MHQRLTADKLNEEGCLRLVEAIVESAAADYRSARAHYKRNPRNKNAEIAFKNARKFFLSDYFHNLTNLDGKAVLQALERDGG